MLNCFLASTSRPQFDFCVHVGVAVRLAKNEQIKGKLFKLH